LFWFWRNNKRQEVEDDEIEDWEMEYWPHRFSYEELNVATNGFSSDELLGAGGFGRVYRGKLPNEMEIAVKCVSHDSKQGLREFMAEISSMGRLQHKNLVQMRGWCRKGNELMLVYDYMPNGSLDKLLFENSKGVLNWSQRYRILKGVAAGLLYLHEEWEQRVVHRDVKASNVLLDADLDGRLGDFGLARLYDHGKHPQTTKVVGTLGYLAPELTRTGKATTNSDVYSYGALLLEVACGRRPVEPNRCSEELVLVEWVWGFEEDGIILEAADRRLRGEYVVEEMETVLKLGLLCSHPNPDYRPNMRHVLQILSGDAPLPPMPSRPAFEGETPPFTALFCSRASSGRGPQSNDSQSTVATDRRHSQELVVFRSS
jgi:serine/threonine protein kinase